MGCDEMKVNAMTWVGMGWIFAIIATISMSCEKAAIAADLANSNGSI